MTVAVPIIAFTLLSAHAQAPLADPNASTLAVKDGEKVIVTLVTHETLSGRVARVSGDGLVLSNGATEHMVAFSDLQRVERPKDSLWNGALIGYGAGFGTGMAMVLANPCHPQPGGFIDLCFDGPGFGALFGGLITGPIGMAVGALADALHRRPRVVFDRLRGPHAVISATPTFVRGRAGIGVVITF